MDIEAEALLQEAQESIEAAQNYGRELQQRLHGLQQARRQVRTGGARVRVSRREADASSVTHSESEVRDGV
ncbi:hypothetical protein NDU88_008010 [Pleurodeles waltl]|uniref:Uncharacterized protein n=1 Tax=Pleurodeles waltl TaxID=8319 RepID=A0AAV7PP68_PLEWA|nr:hypothetical protein NDU88_008010 [Pleurodeles waltl]